MLFEWDKANLNHIARHRVTADEAEQVITNDPFDIERQVVDGEERFLHLGESDGGRILVVAVTCRQDVLRIITAWDAPPSLRRKYLFSRANQWTTL